MSSVDQEIVNIKARIDAAVRLKARAEADRDAARNSADTAMKELTDKYGVTNVSEAKALVAEMQAELASLVSQARQSLDELNL